MSNIEQDIKASGLVTEGLICSTPCCETNFFLPTMSVLLTEKSIFFSKQEIMLKMITVI